MDKQVEEPRAKIVWTAQSIREFLLGGQNPRDAGGIDAHAGKQSPQGSFMPAFLRDCHTRAEEGCHGIERRAHAEFVKHISWLRGNPFAVDNATQQVRAVPQLVSTEIGGHIEHNTSEILDRRKEARNADIACRRDFQAADATPPRGGWKESTDFWPPVVGIFLIEGGIAAVMLWRALGSVRAIATGLILALIALGGGMLGAFVLLRPAKHELVTGGSRFGQWVLAIVVGMVTVLAMYLGACYRAAWIDGLDGTPADAIAKFKSPVDVLVNFDVLALAFLGVAGFIIGALKIWHYYHGYHSLLRDAGLAKAHADQALRDKADELRAFVKSKAREGEEKLEEIEQTSGAWVPDVADCVDSADGSALEANRDQDLVRRILDGIVAEYCDGYCEVRSFDRSVPLSYVINGADIEVPAVFVSARQSAIEAAATVTGAGRQARLDIARVVSEAIRRIDALAGLRPDPTSRDLLADPEDRP